MRNLVKNYANNQRGSMAVMFSITMTVIIMAVAMAIEWSRMTSTYTHLKDLSDGAALAGAIASDAGEKDRKKIVNAFIEANGGDALASIIKGKPAIIFDDDNKTVNVTINVDINSHFSFFLGKKNLDISTTSAASYGDGGVPPISIAFALDVSGSMGWNTTDGQVKLEVLKDASKLLFEALEDGTNHPEKFNDSLRTGMSAYNTALVEDYPMQYGWDKLYASINRLTSGGGTNSTPALQNSYNQLTADRSFRLGQKEDIDDLLEFVIFMTDGDNNQVNWDDESLDLCYRMRDENIQIYSIAFAAPTKGELVLLDCASYNDQEEGLPDNIANNPGNSGPGNANADGQAGCLNSGAVSGGNSQCWNAMRIEKSDYYFDTKDAATFEAAFKKIGSEIAETYIRLTI